MKKFIKVTSIIIVSFIAFVLIGGSIVSYYDDKATELRTEVAGTYKLESPEASTYLTLFDDGSGYVYIQREDTTATSEIMQDVEWEFDKDNKLIKAKEGNIKHLNKIDYTIYNLNDSGNLNLGNIELIKTDTVFVSHDEYHYNLAQAEAKEQRIAERQKNNHVAYSCAKNELNKNLNVPGSLNVINWKSVYNSSNDDYNVYIEYTAKNAFGVDVKGKIFYTIKVTDFEKLDYKVVSVSTI